MNKKLITNKEFTNKYFLRIYKFFVLNTPIEDLSSQSITLKDYNWKNPWKKDENLKHLLKSATNNYDLLFSVNEIKLFENAVVKSNFTRDKKREIICSYNNKKTQFLSVFYHIRNGLAHGRFEFTNEKVFLEKYIIIEDWYKETRRALMRLKIKTLIKWINIIENKK